MAYDRAPRDGLTFHSPTGPFVGPNTYMVDVDEMCGCKAQHMAPFLTSALSRPPAASRPGPAPNAYFPRLRRRIPGGSSLSNKAPRFRDRDPGPKELLGDVQLPAKSKGYIYHCRVPYNISGGPPSVPRKNHCGYYWDDRLLKSINCCDYDTTVGPAFYCLSRYFDNDSVPYWKGGRWSKDRSKRGGLKPDVIPAPNAYTIEGEPNWAQYEADMVRSKKKREAFLPTYLEQLEANLAKDKRPGPAEYTLGLKVCRRNEGKRAPFLVSDKRFRTFDNGHPGPDSYMDPRSAFEKRGASKGPSAFLVNSDRFQSSDHLGPGPATYTLRTFIDELCTPGFVCVRPAAFNTSGERKTIVLAPDVASLPAPNAYYHNPQPNFDFPSAPFRDRSQRGTTKTSDYDVCAATYNVTPSFNKTKNQRSHRRVARFNFGSTAERSMAVGGDGPGPIYNLQNYKPGQENNIGRLADFAARFQRAKIEGPSPAEYSLHPAVGSSVLRRTYNRTLGNPLPQHDGVPSWKSTLRPIKVLRCYVDMLLDIREEQRTFEKQVMEVANTVEPEVSWDPQFPQRFEEANKRLRGIFEKHQKSRGDLKERSRESRSRNSRSRWADSKRSIASTGTRASNDVTDLLSSSKASRVSFRGRN